VAEEKKKAEYKFTPGSYTVTTPARKEVSFTTDDDGGYSPRSADQRIAAEQVLESFGGKRV
jgi:hypothetical protein